MIDDATTDRDLRSPPSNHFEKLRGHLEASTRFASTNGGGCVSMESGRGEAKDVYLDDHSYE